VMLGDQNLAVNTTPRDRGVRLLDAAARDVGASPGS
jgi:hypothetical protein